jgi:Holliday junction resolvasome RuvABC endonuclease subunit
MKVLGLDLSLKATGVCTLSGPSGGRHTHMDTGVYAKPEIIKGVEARMKRLVSIAEDIVGLIEREKPDHIIIEAPAKSQPWQASSLGELHGVIKVQIFLASGMIPMVKEANEMRKAVVGKLSKTKVTKKDKKGKTKSTWSYGTVIGKSGRPRKATIKDIIEARLKERGLEFPSHDEMDAYVAAEYCWSKLICPAEKVVDEKEKTENARAQSGAS